MSDHKERLRESLSALMDGETSEMEAHRVLKEVDQNQDLRSKWYRYQMVSSIISREGGAMVDYSSAISSAIADEPEHKHNRISSFTGNIGRFAIAASVAMVAILGVQQINSPVTEDVTGAQLAGSGNAGEVVGPANQYPAGFQPTIQARTVSAGGSNKVSQYVMPVLEVNPAKDMHYSETELRAYLNNIMLKHSTHAASNSNQGMLPFTRLSKTDRQSEEK